MSRSLSFQDILEEKMREDEARDTRPADVPGATDPAHLAFLLGRMNVFRFGTPARSAPPASTPHRPRPTDERKGPVPFPASRPRREAGPPHALSDRQKIAMSWFARFGETLPPDYTAAELKGAYRRLALRLHPDRSGVDAGVFLELKGHQQALAGVFATTQAA